MTTLFKISDDLAALQQLLEESGGEVTEENQAALDSWRDELSTTLETKLESCWWLLRKWRSDTDTAEAIRDQMDAIIRNRKGSSDWMKDAIKYVMEKNGLKRLDVPNTMQSFSIRGNGGQQSLTVEDGAIPLEYTYADVRIDTEAIRAALEAGKELPFARLEPRGTHLAVTGLSKPKLKKGESDDA